MIEDQMTITKALGATPCPECNSSEFVLVRNIKERGSVFCSKCGFYGPLYKGDEPKVGAIKAWNQHNSVRSFKGGSNYP